MDEVYSLIEESDASSDDVSIIETSSVSVKSPYFQNDTGNLDFFYNNVADSFFMLRVEPDDCFRFISVNESFYKVPRKTWQTR
jgi:hypothetical protein